MSHELIRGTFSRHRPTACRHAVLLFAIALILCPLDSMRAEDKPAAATDWTYNMAFTTWVTNLVGNRYHTFTPESAEKRAKKIADGGFNAVITNGYHYRLNFWSRDDDIRRIAKTIADACHKHGLKVIEHQDWTIHFYDGYPLVFQHPDWLQVDASDMITRHRIYCMNNPEFEAAYLDYLRRYQRETNIDAYQLDEIQFLSSSYCGCRHCQAKYRKESGRDWPPTHDPAFWEEASARDDYRHWMRWRVRSLGKFRGRIRNELRKIRPDVKMFTYTTAMQSDPYVFSRASDIEVKGRYDDTVGTEVNSAPFAGHPVIYATVKSRLALGEAHGKPVVVLNNQTQMTGYYVWAFGRTCRGSLWYALSDLKDGPPQKQLLMWPHQMDDAVSRSAADIAVYLSTSTRDLRLDREYFFREYEGWLQALCLSHNDAKVLLESQLKPGGFDLGSVRLIVLPNATAVSAEQAMRLLQFVRDGGRMLLTYEAGTLDENGKPSAAPLLSEAGIEIQDTLEGECRIELGRPGTYAAALKRVKPHDGTQILATASHASGEVPLLTARSVGKGQILYLAAKLGPLAFEEKQMPTSKYKRTFQPPKDSRAIDIIAAAADRALKGAPRYRVIGAPRGVLAPIYSTVHKGKTCRAVHLLNASGRTLKAGDAIVNPKKERLPMPDLPTFRIAIPGTVRSATLATPEKPGTIDLIMAAKGDVTIVEIPARCFRTYALVYMYE